MLSLHTNTATLSAQAIVTHSVQAQSASSARLSTGYRVNSARDDAAGLQIAKRLRAQSSGMLVAQRNIQNGISLMQTADSVANGMISTFGRMKDLSVQAANGASTDTDKSALQDEFVELFHEVWNTPCGRRTLDSICSWTWAALKTPSSSIRLSRSTAS